MIATSIKRTATRKKTKRVATASTQVGIRTKPLSSLTDECLHSDFANLNGHKPGDLYQLVMGEVEKPLFRECSVTPRATKAKRPRFSASTAAHSEKAQDLQAPGPMSPARKRRPGTDRRTQSRTSGSERRHGLRALLSVSDKTGLVALARGLASAASSSCRPAAPRRRCATPGLR